MLKEAEDGEDENVVIMANSTLTFLFWQFSVLQLGVRTNSVLSFSLFSVLQISSSDICSDLILSP